MNIFETTETLPAVPDNLSIPQFFLDYQGNEQLVTNGQPVQGLEPNPWFIEERTGRKIGLSEVRTLTDSPCPRLTVQADSASQFRACECNKHSIQHWSALNVIFYLT